MTSTPPHATSSTVALTRHTQHTWQSVSNRITMLLLVVCVLIVLWYFSELSLPGTVTGASYFDICPAIQVHC
jgi:hypothetical protein